MVAVHTKLDASKILTQSDRFEAVMARCRSKSFIRIASMNLTSAKKARSTFTKRTIVYLTNRTFTSRGWSQVSKATAAPPHILKEQEAGMMSIEQVDRSVTTRICGLPIPEIDSTMHKFTYSKQFFSITHAKNHFRSS